MDRSKVRIGLFTTGIIAGLTLILYLPVLIWSPPWGEDGYYDKTLPKNSMGYTFTPVHFNSGTLNFHMMHTNYDFKTISYECHYTGRDWYYSTIQGKYEYQTRFHFENNRLNGIVAATLDGDLKGSEEFSYPRITNPFTLWYIKWLEWAN